MKCCEPRGDGRGDALAPGLFERIQETVAFLDERIDKRPSVGIILGSGLGALGEKIEGATAIPYAEIPNFPTSTVKGHKSRLLVGELDGKTVAALQGRFHYYEGYSMEQVTFPVRVLIGLGVETLVVSNAAGGLRPEFSASDLMLITDVINLMGDNPLRGPNDERLGVRFPPLADLFSAELQDTARAVAREHDIPLREGVYAALSGPNYETRAEIRMLRTLGADAVGMSTVPEVIVARHGGMKHILGISCITNVETGEAPPPGEESETSHKAVLEAASRAEERFVGLVRGILART